MMNNKNAALGQLMAVDALNRPTPDLLSGAPREKENRLVGLFYFLWLGEHGRHKPYDISKITAIDPEIGYKPESELWGSYGTYHHWGEPFYGYYYSDDEWVIRHHMKLLIHADIDFLFFDTTNAAIYEKNVKILMSVLQEYHNEGWKIPKVMFYTNTASGQTVQKIYDAIYKPQFCKDTWFCLEGKPVIIAVKEECSPETVEFFNIKMSQWPNEPDKLGGWPWMDFTRPQRVFANLKGEPEVINVSVAQHPQIRFGDSVLYGETTNCGRAYHNGANDPDKNAYVYGYNFEEQFQRAIETDPPIMLITGWNEWIAGRWNGTEERPILFVDCANYEYSRDVEMMRGGYFDNFYMQMVSNIRKYKGVNDIPVYKNQQEAIYYNFTDGDFPRCAAGSGTIYENYTQRNAIEQVKVTTADDRIYFTIKTKKDIIPSEGKGSWMKIYINTGKGQGYDYVLNGDSSTLSSVKGSDLKSETDIGTCPVTVGKDSITVSAALEQLGLSRDEYSIWFKVADSNEEITSIEDFYDKGDAAPLGRLNFVYKFKK